MGRVIMVCGPTGVGKTTHSIAVVHAETGGMSTGVFEYTLGAREDGPIRVDGDLVMKVITAR